MPAYRELHPAQGEPGRLEHFRPGCAGLERGDDRGVSGGYAFRALFVGALDSGRCSAKPREGDRHVQTVSLSATPEHLYPV
jgi:hypothetical protein